MEDDDIELQKWTLDRAMEIISKYQTCIAELQAEAKELGKAKARITELEAQLSEVRAEYQKVTVWLAQSNQLQDEYKARVTQQEAEVKRLRGERWERIIADEKHEQDGKEIAIENQGEWVGIRRLDEVGSGAWRGVWLNELGCVVMRKVAADDPIICCICNKPIEGDDLDRRFWLHEKGCQFVQTGECGCDLECHDECYDGHEHEYAPPFDDEDEEGEPLFDDFGFDEEPDIDDLGDDEDDDE